MANPEWTDPEDWGTCLSMRDQLAAAVRKILKQSGKHMLTYAIVDAVLSEMQHPSAPMLDAGHNQAVMLLCAREGHWLDLWRNMIDAASLDRHIDWITTAEAQEQARHRIYRAASAIDAGTGETGTGSIRGADDSAVGAAETPEIPSQPENPQ